jgi:hypothetical protein
MDSNDNLTFIERANWRDEPEVRALFAGQIPSGEALFSEFTPFSSVTAWLIDHPDVDVWVVRAHNRIVAAGWYKILELNARVIVVTDPSWVRIVDDLLDYIERALRGLTADGRVRAYLAKAWLPHSHVPREMHDIYVQHGWIDKTEYYAQLDETRLRPEPLILAIEAARTVGIEVQSMSPLELVRLMPPPTFETDYLYTQYFLANRQGMPVAVNAIGSSALRGRVAWVTPMWQGDKSDEELVINALLARMLLDALEIPDVLISPIFLNAYLKWFAPDIEPVAVHRYELRIIRY